jgi:probable addiction module antidote protein
MPKRTRDYHEFLLEQLADPVFAADYLNEARQESQKIFLKALRNVAESRRMAVLAAQTGLNRESLYKSLSEDGNPRLETYDSIVSALGFEYEFKPKQAAASQTVPPASSTQTGQQTVTATFSPNGTITVTSTASTAFRNATIAGNALILTKPTASILKEPSTWAHAGVFPRGFIAKVTGTSEEPNIHAIGD